MNTEFEEMLNDLLVELAQASGRDFSMSDLGEILIGLGNGLRTNDVEIAKREFYDTVVRVCPELEPLVRRHVEAGESSR